MRWVVVIAIALLGCRSVQAPDRGVDAANDANDANTNAPMDATADAREAATDAREAATDGEAAADGASVRDAAPARAAVDFRPQKSAAIHEHGGDPAHLHAARFLAHNAGTSDASVSVVRVDFLTGNSCDTFPNELRSSPRVAGIVKSGGAPAARLSLPPGSTAITVEFAPVNAYYTYCNRFAFRVTFDVDGAHVQSTAETEVSRVDPLRRP